MPLRLRLAPLVLDVDAAAGPDEVGGIVEVAFGVDERDAAVIAVGHRHAGVARRDHQDRRRFAVELALGLVGLQIDAELVRDLPLDAGVRTPEFHVFDERPVLEERTARWRTCRW